MIYYRDIFLISEIVFSHSFMCAMSLLRVYSPEDEVLGDRMDATLSGLFFR